MAQVLMRGDREWLEGFEKQVWVFIFQALDTTEYPGGGAIDTDTAGKAAQAAVEAVRAVIQPEFMVERP